MKENLSICIGCGNACCVDEVVLFPSDELDFFRSKRRLQTKYGYVFIIGSKNCVCEYLQDNKCIIYVERPLECRLWPYAVCYEPMRDDIGVFVDKNCDLINDDVIDPEIIAEIIRKHHGIGLDENWFKKYSEVILQHGFRRVSTYEI